MRVVSQTVQSDIRKPEPIPRLRNHWVLTSSTGMSCIDGRFRNAIETSVKAVYSEEITLKKLCAKTTMRQRRFRNSEDSVPNPGNLLLARNNLRHNTIRAELSELLVYIYIRHCRPNRQACSMRRPWQR